MMRRGWPAGFAAAVAMSLLWVPLEARTVPSGEPYVEQLAAGDGHTCAVFSDGGVKCWGLNSDGQLGLGDTDAWGDGSEEMGDTLRFVAVGGWVIQVAAGGAHTCALLDSGEVKCWGRNAYGQLGLGDTLSKGDEPGEMGALPTVALGEPATAISAGATHACAVLASGAVKCWGSNAYGELGQGDTENQGDNYAEVAKLLPVDLGEPALAVSAGSNYTCAVLASGAVKCWGRNDTGQLGLGSTDPKGDDDNEMGDALPAVDLGEVALTVAAGAGPRPHTCALLASGAVKCWGANDFGQLGQGDTDSRGDGSGEMAALPAVELDGTARAVFTGREFSCALLDAAAVRCWGRSQYGQLGLGDISTWGEAPGEMGAALPLVDLGGAVFQLAVGHYHSCALLEWGVVKCWGRNDEGRLGLGDTLARGDGTGEMEANLPAVDLIQDVFAPIVIVPGPMTEEATSPQGALIVFTATAVDAPHPNPEASCNPASNKTFLVGTTPVECSATDAVGNPGWARFTVTVEDTTAPVVTPPPDMSVNAVSANGAAVSYPPATATDAVGVTVGPSCLPASGSLFPVGVTTVGCTASDAAGNVGTATFAVTVDPFEDPIVSPVVQQMSFHSEAAYDGWVLESGETSGVGGSRNATATTARLGDDVSDRQYRSLLHFNTTGLPDNAVITGVTLRIKKQSVVGTSPLGTHGSLTVDVRTGSFGGSAALANGDFLAAASGLNVGKFAKTAVSGWYRATLKSVVFALVNRVGATQFRLRFTVDDNDDRAADYLAFYTGNSTAANRPDLIITYYLP